MLGSDPIYQYDLGVDIGGGPKRIQDVLTLEPISEGGSDPKWIDWYFENNFSGSCLSFGYAQAGQENSFGWERMEKGLEYQFRRLDELQKEGKVTVEKLCDTGKWYKDTYKSTPASSIAAYDGSRGADCASVWYCCKNYRINIYKDGDEFRIRDMYLFNENYPERYKDEVCDNEHSVYDNLPVTDGNALSGNGILGGIYFKSAADSKPLSCCGLQYEEPDGQSLKITALSTECGDIEMVLTPSGFSVSADKDFIMENRINRYSAFCPELKEISEKKVVLNYRSFEYELGFSDGEVQKDGSILSCCGKVKIDL